LARTALARSPSQRSTGSKVTRSVAMQAKGIASSSKVRTGRTRSMSRPSRSFEVSPMRLTTGRTSCVHRNVSAHAAVRAAEIPAARKSPASAPALVPTTTSGLIPSSSRTFRTPACAIPRAAPPPRARPNRRLATAHLLASGAGPLPSGPEQIPLLLGELPVATRHDHFHRLKELLGVVARRGPVRPPGERRHPLRRKRRAHDHRAGPQNTPCSQKCANPGLDVVADQRAELDLTGVHGPRRELEANGVVVVLEIAGRGHGAEIDPAPEIRVADES